MTEELFNPSRPENKKTSKLAEELAKVIALVMIKEFHDKRKVTHQLVSKLSGKYSWDETTDEEHEASKGVSTNNDKAETPFSQLSRSLDHTGRLDPMHAAAMAIAAFNNIFYRSEVEVEKREDKREKLPNGAFISLSNEMKESLLVLSQNLIRAVKEEKKQELLRMQEIKKDKEKAVRGKDIKRATDKYAQLLRYIDLLHSDRCVRDANALDKLLDTLSDTKKLAEVKTQIRIWSIGAGISDAHHPWSMKSHGKYTWVELADHLKNNVYPRLPEFKIPAANEKPEPKMPLQRNVPRLGTHAADVVEQTNKEKIFRDNLVEEAVKLKDEKYRPDGCVPTMVKGDDLVGRRIRMKFAYEEDDEDNDWCCGEVVAVKRNNRVHVEWDDDWVGPGEQKITDEALEPELFNKDVEGAWQVLEEDVAEEEDHDEENLLCNFFGDSSRQTNM